MYFMSFIMSYNIKIYLNIPYFIDSFNISNNRNCRVFAKGIFFALFQTLKIPYFSLSVRIASFYLYMYLHIKTYKLKVYVFYVFYYMSYNIKIYLKCLFYRFLNISNYRNCRVFAKGIFLRFFRAQNTLLFTFCRIALFIYMYLHIKTIS